MIPTSALFFCSISPVFDHAMYRYINPT